MATEGNLGVVNTWGLCLVVAVGGPLVLAACSSPDEPATGASESQSSVSKLPPLTAAEADALERKLKSGRAAEVSAALALPKGQELDPALVQQFASFGAIGILTDHFRQESDVSATVPACVQDEKGEATAWTVTLVRVADARRIAETTDGDVASCDAAAGATP
jgi:hypothetical protein